MDLLKDVGCGDIDEVQVPAVCSNSNPVDTAHVDHISDPASEPPGVGHFLCHVSSQLRSIVEVKIKKKFGLKLFSYEWCHHDVTHPDTSQDVQAAVPHGDLTPFTDTEVTEWRRIRNGHHAYRGLSLWPTHRCTFTPSFLWIDFFFK